jgi:hypothetical protein
MADTTPPAQPPHLPPAISRPHAQARKNLRKKKTQIQHAYPQTPIPNPAGTGTRTTAMTHSDTGPASMQRQWCFVFIPKLWNGGGTESVSASSYGNECEGWLGSVGGVVLVVNCWILICYFIDNVEIYGANPLCRTRS